MSLQDSHQIGDVKVMLKVGADGKGIASIEKTGTAGIVDTYTITFTDGSKTTFEITNGSSIESIEKTQTVGLVDTYTITLTNGETSTFTVTNGEGGGLLPHIIVISETGSVVTLTKGTDVITAIETSTGHFETDVPEYGTWVIDAILAGDDAQVSLVVDACKVYVVDDSHFHADITVNYPNGATCNLSGGSESYYATGSPYTFTVHHADTYTITVVYDGTTYTDTVIVSDSGEDFTRFVPSPSDAPINDIEFWLMFGEVSGSYSSLSDILADSSALSALMASTEAVDYLVRCTDWVGVGLVPVMTSDTTPSGVCSAYPIQTGNDAYKAFDGDESTFWTSGARSGWIQYEFPTPKIVNKVSWLDATTTQRTGTFKIQASNDGFVSETVDLYSGTATAISGEASFSNDTAYKYYRFLHVSPLDNVGFKTLQFYSENICDNSSAMSYIGLNNYASNTLLADSDWCTAICNSAYMESVLNVKVPTMTSYNTPSGVVSESGHSSNYVGWYAFDGNNGSFWASNTNATEYVEYDFGSDNENVVHKIELLGRYANNYSYLKGYIIKASNDGTNWDTLYSGTHANDSTWENIILSNSTAYRYYRLYKNGDSYGNASIQVCTLQFYGREDV